MKRDLLINILGKVADNVSDNATIIIVGAMFALGVILNLAL